MCKDSEVVFTSKLESTLFRQSWFDAYCLDKQGKIYTLCGVHSIMDFNAYFMEGSGNNPIVIMLKF